MVHIKMEKLNFSKIFLMFMMLINIRLGDGQGSVDVSQNESIKAEQSIETLFKHFNYARDPMVNDFKLVQEMSSLDGDHQFLNQANC